MNTVVSGQMIERIGKVLEKSHTLQVMFLDIKDLLKINYITAEVELNMKMVTFTRVNSNKVEEPVMVLSYLKMNKFCTPVLGKMD